jgi:hypothetical protein
LKVGCVGGGGALFGELNIDGVLFPGGDVKTSQISDGTSNTLLAGERWYQLRVWTAGNYFTVAGAGFNPVPPKKAPCGSASSASKNFSSRVPPNAKLDVVGYYINHDNTTDRPPAPGNAPKTLAFNDLPFGSFHTGITNFVRADGGGEVIADDIDTNVYLALASRNGGETVSD